MRLRTLSTHQLAPEQRALYGRHRRQIADGFIDFARTREDGALLGPWSMFLHEPPVGQARYVVVAVITAMKWLPPAAKQVAIIVVGAQSNAAYALYAHAATAADEGMMPAEVVTLAAGGRPLAPSTALLGGGVMPGATHRAAPDPLGQGALNELVLWIGTYAQVAITLNAFDVPSEEVFDR